MRSRNIKPAFWTNEYIAQLPYEGRLLFIGLWNIADREGRLEDRPMRIKAQLFPYDAITHDNIDDLLNQIASFKEVDGTHQFILRYEVDGVKYIEIKNFVSHQRPHAKEQPSQCPAPNLPGKGSGKPGKGRAKPRKGSGEHALNPLYPTLNEESPTPFEIFWCAYPKKASKAEAEKAYKKLNPDAETQQAILDALKWQVETKDWKKDNGQFIPYPASYLNKQKWLDEKVSVSNDIAIKSPEDERELF